MKMQWKSIPDPVFFKVSLCPSGQFVTRSQLKARPVKRRSVLARRCLCIWLLAAVFVGSAHGQPSGAVCTSSSGFLNDSSLCPAIYPISMASGGGGLPLTHLTHLTFCLKDAQVETVGFRVPSARMQALVVVQSLDGLWRKVSFEPDSRSCRRCASCSAANDTLPICSSSGCAGCPLTGVLRISAELLPPPPLLAAMAARQAGLTEAQFLKEYRDQNTEDDLEVVFLCVLAALPGVVTQVALPLRVLQGISALVLQHPFSIPSVPHSRIIPPLMRCTLREVYPHLCVSTPFSIPSLPRSLIHQHYEVGLLSHVLLLQLKTTRRCLTCWSV